MKKPFAYILLFSISVLSGCEDYLEHPVDQRTQLDSAEKIGELLASAYPQADYATFTETLSDLAVDKGNADGVIIDERNENPFMFQDVQNKAQGSPDFYWNACYAAIAAANHALDAIEKAPNPDEYRAFRGEALVARAYSHFMLVSLFSKIYNPTTAASDPGIPYVTAPERVVMGQYDRRTVAYVYEQIEQDLTQGLPLIVNTSYRIPKYHFTTSAAHAFASRFYLFKGDYQKVIAHADQVFQGEAVVTNLRPWAGSYSTMTLLELEAAYTRATENANLLLVEAPSLWARNYFRYRYAISTPITSYLFRSNNVTGARWVQPIYQSGAENVFIPKFREHFVRAGTNANIGFPYAIIPLFSTEEVLFNRAEANVQLGNNAAALADLNTYASTRIENYNPTTHAITEEKARRYYNATTTKEGLIETILDFKAAEFVHEGLRWFDLLRHNKTVVHQTVSGLTLELGPDDPRRVIQIPQEATLAGVERNPR